MKIATSTGDFKFYCPTDVERIRELHWAGFRYIDFDMYSFKPDCVYMQVGWREEVLKLKAVADELGMTFVQAHSQGGNPLDDDEDRVKFLTDATLRSIEICSMLGIENTVVHAGNAPYIGKEEWFDRNKQFYQKLLPVAVDLGVNILTENSTASNMGGRYYIINGRDMREFIDYVDHPCFHGCWDTGHANCEGSQYDEIMALGDALYAIHYNDNHGTRDEHLVPYLGTMNHDEVINALIDVGYKGYFTLECSNELIKYNGWPHKRNRFRDDQRKLSQPQLFMQQHMEALMYDTAKWMLETYGIFED